MTRFSHQRHSTNCARPSRASWRPRSPWRRWLPAAASGGWGGRCRRAVCARRVGSRGGARIPAERTGADRGGGDAALGNRGVADQTRADAGVRAARLAVLAGCEAASRTLGGVLACKPCWFAADKGRGRARPFPRISRGQWARRNLQGRRQGRQERHRLRFVQIAGGLLRHAGGARGGHGQGIAAARGGGHGAAAGWRAGGRRAAHGRRCWRRRTRFPVLPILPAGAGAAGCRRRDAGRRAGTVGCSLPPRCVGARVSDAIGTLAEAETEALWRGIGEAAPLTGRDGAVWRVSVAPSRGAALGRGARPDDRVRPGFSIGGGGLVWLATAEQGDAGAEEIRRAIGGEGHATLVRGAARPGAAAVPVFEPFSPWPPQPPGSPRRVKDGFDPRRILNRGRMVEGAPGTRADRFHPRAVGQLRYRCSRRRSCVPACIAGSAPRPAQPGPARRRTRQPSRGIYLIKNMLEGGAAAAPETVKHIDRCLSCLSCMTTCPSGVNYMHLVDHGRRHIEQHHRRPLPERALAANAGRSY